MKLARALALAALLPLTSGCIAAVVPLAAGAALARTQTGREEPRSAAPRVAAAPAAVASAGSDLKLVRTNLTALPAPSGLAPPANPAIPAFRSYALAQAALAPGGKRASAILSAATQLRAVRAECGNLPSAVFVDLDPGRGTFDPLAPGAADPALGAALADLRASGAKIVWFSRLGANFADAARGALATGPLDPAGGDELVLMRDIGERKQSVRDEVAKRLCPIAMLGDERADFDELYLYLKNPGFALALDTMIGKGWFLASPFAPEPSPTQGTTP